MEVVSTEEVIPLGNIDKQIHQVVSQYQALGDDYLIGIGDLAKLADPQEDSELKGLDNLPSGCVYRQARRCNMVDTAVGDSRWIVISLLRDFGIQVPDYLHEGLIQGADGFVFLRSLYSHADRNSNSINLAPNCVAVALTESDPGVAILEELNGDGNGVDKDKPPKLAMKTNIPGVTLIAQGLGMLPSSMGKQQNVQFGVVIERDMNWKQ